MSNAFAILDVSDNEEEVPRKQQGGKTPADAKKTAQSSTTTKPKPAAEKKVDRVIPGMPKPKPVAAAPVAPPAAPAAAPADADASKDNNRGGRGRGKDNARRGEKKHGKEAEADARHRRVKHEKDRHSTTEKEGSGNRPRRGGRGAFNTGSVEQEAQDAEKDPEAAVADATAEPTDATAEPSEEAAAPEVVEGVKTITLDDYLRQKDSSKVLGLNRSTLLTEEETKTAKNVKKAVVDLSFQFAAAVPAPRPREDGEFRNRRNDSRGGPRGQKGGAPKGGDAKKSGPAVNISASDFPALL